MTQQLINIGISPNDGNGDPLRTAFGKINNNFSELFQSTLPSGPDGSVQYRAANDITSIAWGNNVYLGLGKVNRVYTSTDGTNWVSRAGPLVNLVSAVWNGTFWVAVGDGGAVWTSPDTITWTQRATTITANLLSVAISNTNVLCAVSAAGEIITSTDGITWVARTSGVATALRGVTWSQALGTWITVGDSGAILVSVNNGVTWVPVASGVGSQLNAVTATTTDLFAVGNGGIILNSVDAITWSPMTSTVITNLNGVTSVTIGGDTTAFACGDGGVVLSTSVPATAGWDATIYPSPTTATLLSATEGNSEVFMTGIGGVIVRFTAGALELDNIPGGLTGSAKFVFNPEANLLTLDSNLRPGTTNTWSLGSNTQTWREVWINGASGLTVGDVSFYASGNTLTLHEVGNIASLSNLVVNTITVAGNATYGNVTIGNLTVTGNTTLANATANVITANTGNFVAINSTTANFTGNTTVGGNLQVNGNVIGNGSAQFTGNVSGNYILGNGALLSGLPTPASAVGPFGAIQWSNGAGFNLFNANLYWDNATETLYSPNFSGNIQGNITGNFVGNLIGNVTGDLTGNVTGNLAGNVQGQYGNFFDVNVSNRVSTATLVTTGNSQFGGNVTVVGNLVAAKFTALVFDAVDMNVSGNLNVSGYANFLNVTVADITIANANINELEVYHSNTQLANIDSLTGNLANIIAMNANSMTSNSMTANWGNFVNLNAQLGTFTTANAVTFNGNSNANVVTAGRIEVNGNIIAGNITANGNIYGNLIGNITTNDIVANSVTANYGNFANLATTNLVTSTITANLVGNVVGNVQGNIFGTRGVFSGNVDADIVNSGQLRGPLVGNVTGNVQGNISGAYGNFTLAVNTENVTANGQLISNSLTTGNATLLNVNMFSLVVGANITAGNIDGGNLVQANYLRGVLTTGAQPNITSVGPLTDLQVIGNIAAGGNITGNNLIITNDIQAQDAVITGNLVVQGNTTYTNTNTLIVESPIIELGGLANNQPLTLNDGKDRGLELHYYTTQPVDAFMGFQNSTGNFILASNATFINDVVTVNQYGNLTLNNMIFRDANANMVTANSVDANAVAANFIIGGVISGDGGNLTGLPVQTLTAGSNITLVDNAGNWTINAALVSPAAGANREIQFADATGNFDASPDLTFNTADSNLTVSGNVIATDFYGNFNGTHFGNVDGIDGLFVGTVTAPEFVGNITGNVIGNVVGNISGATGTFTDDVTANNFTAANTVTANLLTAPYANVGNIRLVGSNITEVGTLDLTIQTEISNIVIQAPRQIIANTHASNITLQTGNVFGYAHGGDINLFTGDGGLLGNAGNINLRGGDGGAGGIGGNILLIAGNTNGSPNTITGSKVYIQGGDTLEEDAGAVIIKGGNASTLTSDLLYGGNIFIDGGTGTFRNGNVFINQLRFPFQDGNANWLMITDGSGKLSLADPSNLGLGGFQNVLANGTLLTSQSANVLSISASNVTYASIAPRPTVAFKVTPGSSVGNVVTPSKIELRVTPTGIYFDNPFAGNLDCSTTGNTLASDFNALGGEEADTNWFWDMSQNPRGGLQSFDLGTLP